MNSVQPGAPIPAILRSFRLLTACKTCQTRDLVRRCSQRPRPPTPHLGSQTPDARSGIFVTPLAQHTEYCGRVDTLARATSEVRQCRPSRIRSLARPPWNSGYSQTIPSRVRKCLRNGAGLSGMVHRDHRCPHAGASITRRHRPRTTLRQAAALAHGGAGRLAASVLSGRTSGGILAAPAGAVR